MGKQIEKTYACYYIFNVLKLNVTESRNGSLRKL